MITVLWALAAICVVLGVVSLLGLIHLGVGAAGLFILAAILSVVAFIFGGAPRRL